MSSSRWSAGGRRLQDLKKLAEEKSVADFMTFTGRAPDQLLLEVLNTADICINPDEVNPMNDKSTMNKIMEYMALGKPIVQFDVTEGRFSAGPASLYAKANDAKDMADAVVYLLDRPALREEMGRQGRARVETGTCLAVRGAEIAGGLQRGLRRRSRRATSRRSTAHRRVRRTETPHRQHPTQ